MPGQPESASSFSTLSWLRRFGASAVFQTPEELAAAIESVSREEVILAANLVSEDTVYILTGSEKEA